MNPEKYNIDPETLQQWLAEGRRVMILDIRKTVDRAEWWIPGSIHVDAYEALKAGDSTALANIELPEGIPVVTVCGIGKIAQIAAQQLQARGIQAIPLAGGMKGWSHAWNIADVITIDPFIQIVQFRRTGKGCLSYLIASHQQAAVLDPSLEPENYLQVAESRGWRIIRILETHIHADHLSRGRQLAKAADAELRLPWQNQASGPLDAIHNSDRITIGSIAIEPIPTPGHTAESTSYLIESQGSFNGHFLFTGDTLFVTGVGRPDIGTEESGAHDRASMLYHSLRRLLSLEPSTLVLPGHHNQPIEFDGQPIAVTLGELKAKLPPLAQPEPAFIEWILACIPATPPNYLRIAQLNKDGIFPDGDPTDMEAGGNRCAVS